MNHQQGTCGACGESIVGDSIRAFGMQWHVDHLVCNVCQKDFSGGVQVCEGNDGFAYCVEDWKRTFCPQCAMCKEAIVGPTINALNKSFHPEHFVCFICREKLEGQFFPSEDGMPLCEKDYYDSLGLMCGGCGNPIIAGKAITMPGEEGQRDVKFHLDHFKCAHCQKNIAGQKYKKRSGKPYCVKCHLQLFE